MYQKEIGWLLQEKYNGKLTAAAKGDIKRLKAGEPLDYVIGFTEFLGCKIMLNKNVLIPRAETEFWVQKAIEEIKVNGVGHHTVLDMFAGSGCIGISIMRHIKNANVVFADSQKDALSQIKKNCVINTISKNRYAIIESDIFSDVKGTFDYIFANPPYIPNNQKTINKIQKSVIDYEPEAALFGGKDGLLYITRFLAEAKSFLNPNGKIYMEFDGSTGSPQVPPQKIAIEKMLKTIGYKRWQFHKDQYAKWRYIDIKYNLS